MNLAALGRLGRMAILPGVGAYDYEPVAILEVGEGDWSGLSAATTRDDQKQDGHAANRSTHPSAACPVNVPVELPNTLSPEGHCGACAASPAG